MTRANAEQQKHTPWFAKAGAACSIVPISRAVGANAFALKGGGYAVLFSAEGTDPESLTDQELEAKVRGLEGALRGLPEGFTLYQYTRILSGFDIPRQASYADPVTENFVTDRLTFLDETAKFRRVDLHWCLAVEPPQGSRFSQKPRENADENSRQLAELLKAAAILESHLGHSIGLQLLHKNEAFKFFSYLFNLEDWAESDELRGDTGVDRQIVKSAVSPYPSPGIPTLSEDGILGWGRMNGVEFEYERWKDERDRSDSDYEGPDPTSKGWRLFARAAEIQSYLQAAQRDLIIEISLKREKGGRSHQRHEKEESAGVRPIEGRFTGIFLFREDGSVLNAERRLGTWKALSF